MEEVKILNTVSVFAAERKFVVILPLLKYKNLVSPNSWRLDFVRITHAVMLSKILGMNGKTIDHELFKGRF